LQRHQRLKTCLRSAAEGSREHDERSLRGPGASEGANTDRHGLGGVHVIFTRLQARLALLHGAMQPHCGDAGWLRVHIDVDQCRQAGGESPCQCWLDVFDLVHVFSVATESLHHIVATLAWLWHHAPAAVVGDYSHCGQAVEHAGILGPDGCTQVSTKQDRTNLTHVSQALRPGLPVRQPSIDHQVGAVHKAGVIARQPQSGLGDVLRQAGSAN
jgi:hypothetical protein